MNYQEKREIEQKILNDLSYELPEIVQAIDTGITWVIENEMNENPYIDATIFVRILDRSAFLLAKQFKLEENHGYRNLIDCKGYTIKLNRMDTSGKVKTNNHTVKSQQYCFVNSGDELFASEEMGEIIIPDNKTIHLGYTLTDELTLNDIRISLYGLINEKPGLIHSFSIKDVEIATNIDETLTPPPEQHYEVPIKNTPKAQDKNNEETKNA